MKRVSPLLAFLLLISGCSEAPVTTETRTVMLQDNLLNITDSDGGKSRYVTVKKAQPGWQGDLAGGKEQWQPRSGFLYQTAAKEIANICGAMSPQIKDPVFNMLGYDKMVASGIIPAQSEEENVPTGVYVQFSCLRGGKSR